MKPFNPYDKSRVSPFVIAEVGINHNGDIDIAKKLISLAHQSGCDAVKFQKRTIDEVYTAEYLSSPRESPWGKTQREQKEGLEFSRKDFVEISKYCKSLGILWTASTWDLKSQEFLKEFNVPFNKIASPMLTHKDLLESVAEEGKHTFISTGMSSYQDISRAVKIFKRRNCPFTLLHCVSKYPSDDFDCNVGMIYELKRKYNCPVGYSGHEVGLLPSVLAVALGAVAIERHITLDRAMYGSDQSASLEKKGLELLVRDTRRVKKILGTGTKELLKEEIDCAKKLRYFSSEDFDWDQ
jgi:N-acetylneuraminate synthase